MNPRILLVNFYKWYLRNLRQNSMFFDTQTFKNMLPTYFTPACAIKVQTTRESYNADPIICAQDVFFDWIDDVGIKELEKNVFIMAFGPKNKPKHQTKVTIMDDGNQIKINDIELYEPPTT